MIWIYVTAVERTFSHPRTVVHKIIQGPVEEEVAAELAAKYPDDIYFYADLVEPGEPPELILLA